MGPGKKRWWHSNEIERKVDAEFCLKEQSWYTILGLFAVRELFPVAVIIV